MSRELYAGVSGATAAWSQLDTIAHNLANVSTSGFKARKLSFQSARAQAEGALGEAYVQPVPIATDLTNGAVQKTGNPYDLAIQGEGFFSVEDPQGKVWLTRSGSFRPDSQGFLVTPTGEKLRSSAGPVQIPQGDGIVIGEDGAVRLKSGAQLGTLEVLSGDVRPVGSTLWEAEGPLEDVVQAQQSLAPGEARRVAILQGHLEKSNVDPLESMVELIEASRLFEAYQNIMKASDEADSRLIQAGRT